jgi:alanine racemase
MARAWVDVDLDAVAHNVRTLRLAAASGHGSPAQLCAVVKANGYGHGAQEVAQAALAAGADWLAVAQVEEAVALRDAGIDAPLLVLSEPRSDELATVCDLDVRVTVYTPEAISKLVTLIADRRSQPAGPVVEGPTVKVHLKIDTGMRRVGAAPGDAVALAKAIADAPELDLEGVFTHCPVADEPASTFTASQLARFDAIVREIELAGIPVPLRHAANSAATIGVPGARYDLVRCGIAVYGIPPAPAMDGMVDLRPALTLCSEVSFVKEVAAGEGISYGHRERTSHDSVIATIPIGYADGVFRSLPLHGAEVLIGGVRRPMVGVVTMDQLMVDCGPPGAETQVRQGDPVVLLGQQGSETITPDDWAARLGTIAYEIVCAIGPRVERRYVGTGAAC